jgi:outer membrane protein assembly factor BamE (lipoprotein component of BamABCDE complex)
MDMDFKAFRAKFYPRLMLTPVKRGAAWLLPLALLACDRQRVDSLEEGVATEADVRAAFGEPEAVWDGPGGERVFEYDRQPSGQRNYMISIGPDGRMTALRQVLQPRTFEQVRPGMSAQEVRRMLGKPARQTPYALKDETAWDWRWIEPPNTPKVFTVWFDRQERVVRTSSGPDPDAAENRGG